MERGVVAKGGIWVVGIVAEVFEDIDFAAYPGCPKGGGNGATGSFAAHFKIAVLELCFGNDGGGGNGRGFSIGNSIEFGIGEFEIRLPAGLNGKEAVGDRDVGGVVLGGSSSFPFTVIVAISPKIVPFFKVEGYS